MNKTVGYSLAGAGIVATIFSNAPVRNALQLTLPFNIPENYLFYAGLGLIVIGTIMAFNRRKPKQPSEVPIYHGKNIVGYRRLHH